MAPSRHPTTKRGFVQAVPIVGIAVAAVVGIGLIVGVLNALGRALMGKLTAGMDGFSFSGSYETVPVLDGLPLETQGRFAIENHLALTDLRPHKTGNGSHRYSRDIEEQHFSETGVDQRFSGDPAGRRLVRSYSLSSPAALISTFPGGKIPPDDETWYVNQRWCYSARCFKGQKIGNGRDYSGKRVVVTNPKNGRSIVASVIEWGPGVMSRVAGLSPEASVALGAKTDDNLTYGWAVDQNVPLGPVQAGGGSGGSGPVSGPSNAAEGAFTGSGFTVNQSLRIQGHVGGSGMNSYYARPTYIVLHYLATDSGGEAGNLMTAREAQRYFVGTLQDSNSDNNKYVQFIIARDGTIYQLLPETKQAAGACGFNRTPDGVGVSISIENEGHFEMNAPHLQFTQAQVNANIQLVKYLMQKWNIPKSHVVSHEWVFKNHGGGCGARSDPGDQFMNRVMSGL